MNNLMECFCDHCVQRYDDGDYGYRLCHDSLSYPRNANEWEELRVFHRQCEMDAIRYLTCAIVGSITLVAVLAQLGVLP